MDVSVFVYSKIGARFQESQQSFASPRNNHKHLKVNKWSGYYYIIVTTAFLYFISQVKKLQEHNEFIWWRYPQIYRFIQYCPFILMLEHRLLWAHSWMDGSEQWVWYQSFGSAYRSSLRFDPEYWENISTNPQQLFPLINKLIENASCFPGSQDLLYAELLDLRCFWFLVTFLHRAQYAVKRLCIICFLSSALTDTLMAFCLFLIPWYQICYEQNWNISMYFSNSCNSC